MNLRCRGPDGQVTLSGLDPAMTVAAFQQEVANRLSVPPPNQELLAGFPPKLLQIPQNPAEMSISALGLATGDTVVVRRVASATPSTVPETANRASQETAAVDSNDLQAQQLAEDEALAQAIAASLSDPPPASTASVPRAPSATASHTRTDPQGAFAAQQPEQGSRAAHTNGASTSLAQPQPAVATKNDSLVPSTSASWAASVTLPDGSCMVRRKVDDDNSCLFSSVAYVMQGSRAHAAKLRKVVAEVVAKDPFTYNDGFLGKSNEEYQNWIVDPKKWGGAIELSIFARHFGREIAAYDIQTKRCDIYGQGDGFRERAMLIYDGLHYDALAISAFDAAPEELDMTIVEQSSQQAPAIDRAAAALTAQAHERRQFTDVARFTLRCGVCKIGVKGEKEAVEHAKKTGHTDFSEYH